MKYVICRYNGNSKGIRLTVGKLYEVLEYFNSINYGTTILIKDNSGDEMNYSMIGDNNIAWFEDATAEIREEKLNKILKTP